ncbi:fucosyl transferase [Teladorsagia circumcincta]|uniref:Fucosyltransferase n=1 Tax=Teladorsagia circumcincta TaxID=45464 RepID=A0A2G9V1F5_TELCI|nr:fucosyl transferase [Teladorsagia circumcincta]
MHIKTKGARYAILAMRWKFPMLTLLTLSACGVLYYSYSSLPESGEALQEPRPTSIALTKKVVIYAATKFFGMDITTERFLSECHSTKGYCRISENKADLDIADAVLFHNADYSPISVPKPRDLRRPHVLWSLESPSNDFFRPGPRCNGIDKQSDKCVAELVRPYKFYIAFENSNCVDYVTEKFFETLISRMAVPIVIKRAIYTNVGAPESSFIALDDFQTVADMVKFIKEVAADKEKARPEHDDDTGFCELCRRLQQKTLGYMSYADVRKWHADGILGLSDEAAPRDSCEGAVRDPWSYQQKNLPEKQNAWEALKCDLDIKSSAM